MSLGSFFKGVLHFFEHLGHSNAWEKSASTTIDMIAPLTDEIVALTAGEAAAAEVQSVVNEVQNGLALVSGVLASGQTSDPAMTGKAQAALSAVQSNLGSLLTAGHIKNTATLSKVQGIANTIIGETKAILEHLAAAHPISGTPAPSAPSA